MPLLLPPWPVLGAFLIASLVLAVAPGPAVLYIVTRSLALGRRAGLASAAGIAFGNLANAIAAALGLAALLAVSSLAFEVFKYAGAAYLVYLGIQTWRIPAGDAALPRPASVRLSRIFGDAFTVAVLNPKTTLFFVAFLPQFVGPRTHPLGATLTLAALFIAVAALTDTAYAVLSGSVARALSRTRALPRLGRRFSAISLIGLGMFTALAGGRRLH